MARENVRVFNPQTGQYEKPKAEHKALVAEHEAQIEGQPAPGDRTIEELAALDPGMAGPTLTSESVAGVDSARNANTRA